MRGLLVADAISLTGTRLSMIAIPWFVLTTTGSATQTGLVAAAELTPMVLFKVLGGPFTDRYGGRRIAIASDLASALVVAAIPLLHAAGALSFPALLALVGLAGALRGPGDGAKHALVPVVARHAGVPLERVTGLYGAIERTATMAGAALAGLVIATLGASNALLIDAGSFAVCAVTLATTTRGLPVVPPAQRDPTPYLRQLRSGWDFLRRDPVLVGMSAMVATTNLLDVAWSAVLMPVWGTESGYGAAGVGALFAVWSAASALSALAAAKWGPRLPRFRAYLVGFMLTVPRFAVLALDAPLWVCVAVFALGGFSSGVLNPILGAVIFERIPEPLVGRVSAINSALCWSLMPLGGPLGGFLASQFGIGPALWAVGGAYLVATLAPLVVPSFREFDRRPAPHEPPILDR